MLPNAVLTGKMERGGTIKVDNVCYRRTTDAGSNTLQASKSAFK